MSDAKAIEQFVLAHNGGVLLPISVPKVCELLLDWSAMAGSAEDVFVPGERRCPACNYRRSEQDDPHVLCPIDGTAMVSVTWKEAALTASRIASRARKRCEILLEAWPEDRAIPVSEEAEDKSIEEKIEFLQEKGLHNILFRNAGVGLMFFEPPEDYKYPEMPDKDEWRKYLIIRQYYPSFDEAIESEYLKRIG